MKSHPGSDDSASSLRPPRQARSRATLNRIVEATEALLVDSSFENLAVDRICRNSGASVGAFYGRFGGKDGLLSLLEQRCTEELEAELNDLQQRIRSTAPSLGKVTETLCTTLHDFFAHRRGVLRALSLRNWRAGERRSLLLDRQLDRAARLLCLVHPQTDHPRSRLVCTLGISMVVASLAEKILFNEASLTTAVRSEQLATEVATAVTAYLASVP